MKLKPGDKIDRYVVKELLGAGGTALVYLVEHIELNTRHALKQLTISGESIKRRLLQEGQAQATLGHLNIVAVTDIVDIGGQPGLLMEYIEGPNLEDALADYKISMADAETLFLGVLAGVRAAHSHGLVHRDLKPANVLLAPSAAGFVPKVTDFGLAKAVRGKAKKEGATQQGVAMGTPSYMAPEQIRDAGNVDERADIFSLGCILYEVFTGRRAFPGDDIIEIYTSVSRGEYLPIRKLIPDVPDRIEQAIEGCIQVDKDKRIPSCEVLLSVLRGEQTWDRGEAPNLPANLQISNGGANSKSAALSLAPRNPDGGTPMPPPRRLSGAGGGFGIQRPTSQAEPERASRWPSILVAVLLGVSIAALILLLLFAALGVSYPMLMQSLKPPTTVEVRATQPMSPPIEVQVEPAPVEQEITPAPLATDEPSAEPEPPSPAPVTQPTPNPRSTAPVIAPKPRPTSKAKTRSIKLWSDPPSAEVTIDGQASGRRTPAKLTLPVGSHKVIMDLRGTRKQFTINVGSKSPKGWCLVFATKTIVAGGCPNK